MNCKSKICPCCKLDKPILAFNREHSFPDAVGGLFIVNHICRSCNTLFNQKIDEPFVKSNFVLYHRHRLNLSDGRSNIPGISKEPIIDSDGNKRLVVFENGQFLAKLIPKHSYQVLPDGRVECKLEIDAGSLDRKDEIIKKFITKISKDLGTDLGSEYIIKEQNIKQHNLITFTKEVDNNVLIRECVKIAFEFATLLQPEYLEDPFSDILRDFLFADEPTERQRKHFDETYLSKGEEYVKRMLLFNLHTDQHAIFIENVAGEGVFFTIKIFGYFYSLKISENSALFPNEEFLFVNDLVTKKLYSSQSLGYRLIRFYLEFRDIPELLQKKIREKGIGYFEINNGSFMFYRADGTLRYEGHQALAGEMTRSAILNRNHTFDENETTFDLALKKLFIRTIEGELVPVLSITVQPTIIGTPLPKFEE